MILTNKRGEKESCPKIVIQNIINANRLSLMRRKKLTKSIAVEISFHHTKRLERKSNPTPKDNKAVLLVKYNCLTLHVAGLSRGHLVVV